MKNTHYILPPVLAAFGGLLTGMGIAGSCRRSARPRIITDTIIVRTPAIERLCTVGIVQVRVPATAIACRAGTDSVDGGGSNIAIPDLGQLIDSLDVELPRQQAVYSGDGYRAFVSGYAPALDSLVLTPRQVQPSVRRFGIGIQGGVGITPAGLQPYLGIGFSYRL